MPKLLCVIIDGLLADTLACAHVRCFDHLIRNGSVSRQVQALPPDLTLPSLVSLFTSLLPEEHGILTNSGASMVSPHAVSLFSLLRYRNLNSSVFYSNECLRPLFPAGSLQSSVFINSQGIRNVDRELAEQARLHLQKEKPDFCLLYLQGADIAGTHSGVLSEPHLESVEQADQALDLLLEYLAVVGLQQDYVIMVLGCHGGAHAGRGERRTETRSPLILVGPGILRGVELQQPLSFFDLTPTMARILGVAPHPDWRGTDIENQLRQSVVGIDDSRAANILEDTILTKE